MQTKLLQVVCEGKAPPRDAALCARAWIDLERLKREMRGIPPLGTHKLTELLRDARMSATPRRAPLELDAEPA